MTEKRSALAFFEGWWQRLTSRERLLVGVLPFIALAGAAYILNLETNARLETLVEARQELNALGQASAGAWLSARQRAATEHEIVLNEAFTAINEASAREYIRGTLDKAAVDAGIPSLTVQVRSVAPVEVAEASEDATPTAREGVQFLEVDIAAPFKWNTFLAFQSRLAAYREFTAWSALSFDEAGDARFRATLKVAFVLQKPTP